MPSAGFVTVARPANCHAAQVYKLAKNSNVRYLPSKQGQEAGSTQRDMQQSNWARYPPANNRPTEIYEATPTRSSDYDCQVSVWIYLHLTPIGCMASFL